MLTTVFRDRLPRGLSFPLGIEVLRNAVPALARQPAAVLFVWQSTWASQLYDPKWQKGRHPILHFGSDLPRMRINSNKVRPLPDGDGIVVILEYPIISKLRKHVLEAFAEHGASLTSARLAAKERTFGLLFKSDTNSFEVQAKDR